MSDIEQIKLREGDEFIELYKVLKIQGMISAGAEAKLVIAEGLVTVNGEVETRKRKKLVSGDLVSFNGESVVVVGHGEELMSLPDDDNGKMLAAMAEAGMDLSQPIDVDFFLVFDEQRDAETALEDLINSDSDGEAELMFNEETAKHEIIVTINMIPEYEAILAQEAELNDFADEYDGMTDGWGVMQHQEGDDDFADEAQEGGESCSRDL